jgi:ketosteroid isomerase-like protein/quercetin dioxygenase-like cupin family protein
MKTHLLALVVLAVPSVALAEKAAAPAKGAADKGGDKAVAELKAIHEKMNKTWETGDTAAFKDMLSDTFWMGWDIDEAGRPVQQASKAEVIKMMDDMQKMMKAMNAKMSYTQKMLDCKVSGDLGVCIQEGEGSMTAEKMPPMAMTFRETNVFKKEKGAWKGIHHHGSLARWPELPAKSIAMTAKTAQWMDLPGQKNMKMSPLWMNPVTQQGVALIKFTADGKLPRHIHPHASAYYVIEGGGSGTIDGKEVAFTPGTVVYRAPKEVHTSTMKAGTVMFSVIDGPMVDVMVDEKGNPLPQTAQK